MRKWMLVVPLLGLLLLAGFVAAGPYIAIHGIRDALAEQDTGKLDRYVDFPTLRLNLRAQLQDRMVRAAGVDAQSSFLGALALSLAGGAAGVGVDAMVTPTGIAAILQGRSVWKRALGDTANGDTYGPPAPAEPLKGAEHHYESLSRFTATTRTDSGAPITFVFERQGLVWKLTDIRLPL
ncbi:DUF2939 domain-containing protein [Pseudoxanthomonas winnipegensis]|uniref:DUF2939 domain-containing protein n=1 Tax=Pseudoxanthomonas winnipegensis TaxID=2480810 RepID=A0A4Q8L7K1_9GAMM|nr:DUF2939 domain-containing protein [Pseudoxanthomonas winnipegensis]TAA23671.1 DUF2939 domain-containing protein [Pseudoxanthomonas winnipegensis]